jgi:hypothetical protein
MAALPGCQLLRDDIAAPQVGDFALVQVTTIGYHSRIATTEGHKLRLYPGDVVTGVFGNRYATDAFEAEVRSTENLHILTDAGMIGTVRSRHAETKRPTELRFLGYLGDTSGQRLNLRAFRAHPAPTSSKLKSVLLVVGTAMNSGKTTTAAKLVKSLLRRGIRVTACKLTGSVCQRDRGEFHAAGAHFAQDFSDYGFPSTYLATEEQLLGLFESMLADAAQADPDITVLEVADGVLQRETKLLLGHSEVRRRVDGVVLAAPCSASALFGIEQLHEHGHRVVAVSGRITNSPLCMREFADGSSIPVASSAGDADELAALVIEHFRLDS